MAQGNNSEGNKRIAKNTIIVYIRLFSTMFIGLLSSRFVLKALGISDYGLYNVVGGVLALFGFISGSLSATTTRFINFEMGKKDRDTNKIFNVCNTLHISFAILLFILAETIGIWYIRTYLNVAPGKVFDAMFVYQISTLVAIMGIINVPYSSMFIATERFGTMAIIDIGCKFLQLIWVYLLIFYHGDALRLYAICMSFTTLITFILYHVLCYRYWPETVKLRLIKDKKEYKPLLSFNNYNMLSTVSIIARGQGSNILINFFFGTAVNGAYAIANSVQSYVNQFMSSFDQAAEPQITQNLGNGDQERSEYIAMNVCKICILLALLVIFPLLTELNFIIKLWLGIVPANTLTFCYLTLFISLFSSTSGGLAQYITGTGKIKWFRIIYSILFLSVLPVGFVLYKLHYPAYSIFILFIASDVIYRGIQLILVHRLFHFNSGLFIRHSYIRPAIIMFIMVLYWMMYKELHIITSSGHLLGLIINIVISGLLVFFIGLNSNERRKIKELIYNKIHKKVLFIKD
jgi:O-antigen/teichoic acid export membrane protein